MDSGWIEEGLWEWEDFTSLSKKEKKRYIMDLLLDN